MLKKQELSDPGSCLNKADANEPIFVIRAKDVLAPMLIRHWATMADGIHEHEKVLEARILADAIDEWRMQPMRDAVPMMPVPGQVYGGPVRR